MKAIFSTIRSQAIRERAEPIKPLAEPAKCIILVGPTVQLSHISSLFLARVTCTHGLNARVSRTQTSARVSASPVCQRRNPRPSPRSVSRPARHLHAAHQSARSFHESVSARPRPSSRGSRAIACQPESFSARDSCPLL